LTFNIEHSEAGEESLNFLFKSKNQKRDPSAFGLRMARKGKFTKILKQSMSFLWYDKIILKAKLSLRSWKFKI
jgi:hypothetical protein